MINHNLLLYELLDRTITVNFNNKDWLVNYTEGDLYELTTKLNDSKTKYPIIWLQSGYKVERNKIGDATKLLGCKFFFITKGSSTDRYEQRFASTFNEILYKSLLMFDKKIIKSKGIQADNLDEFTTFPFNDTTELNRKERDNGSKSSKQTATITDIWDALLLETNLSISNGCYPQLIIK